MTGQKYDNNHNLGKCPDKQTKAAPSASAALKTTNRSFQFGIPDTTRAVLSRSTAWPSYKLKIKWGLKI